MKNSMRGFTLVELLVVIAITGILAGIWAKQAHKNRIKQAHRAKTIAAFSMMQRPKVAVSQFFAFNGKFPIDNTEAGLPSPDILAGIETENIEVRYGAIHVTLKKSNEESTERVLSMRPAVMKAEPYGPYITWLCGNADADAKLMVFGLNRTNIRNEYLPKPCRGSGAARGVESVTARNVKDNAGYYKVD